MFAKLSSVASSFVNSGYSFPYTLGAPYSTGWGCWTHFKATSKSDGSDVSVFRISAANKSDPKLVSARNGVKRMKILRHPHMLLFKDTAEIEERGETVVYLVTQAVTPLENVLTSLDMTGTAREQYIAMGLHHISTAVAFLNNDCKLIHGNVSMQAVVVTDTLDWKLYGLDLVSEHQWAGEFPLMSASWMVGAQYKSGEVAKSDWTLVRDSPPWAVDAWGLGCLMQEVYRGHPLARTEDLRVTEHIPKDVLPLYQRLLASAPGRRLNPSTLAESGVLKNKLVDTMSFLENLSLKEGAEKDFFFKRLSGLLPSIPLPVQQRKLLPLLANALEFGGAPPVALAALLSVGKTLDEADYRRLVVPAISKLFASTDRGIRRSLLENINDFGPALPADLIEEQIYNHVANGFTDSNAFLRELTLKSMLVLGPKLSQKTLNQSLLKHLAKLQVDEEPSIRANTTILLGNMAPHLSEATCKKVLLNAFTRAIRDTFPPARVAGVKAILATAKVYSAEDAAVRILPAIGPLCVDPVADVRAAAIMTVEHFVKGLKDNHAEIVRTTVDGVGAPTSTATDGSTGVAAAQPGWGSGMGWAMNSLGFTRGVAAPKGEEAPGSSSRTETNNSHGGPPSSSRQSEPSSTSPQSAAPPPEPAPRDGWGDDDDPLEDMVDHEEEEARKRLTSMGLSAARKPRPTAPAVRPAQQLRPASTTNPPARPSQQGGQHVQLPGRLTGERGSSKGSDDEWADMDAQSKPAVFAPARGVRRGVTRKPALGAKPMKLTGVAKPDINFDDF